MRIRLYFLIAVAGALGLSFLATSDLYSQRGEGRGKAGKSAGHKAASAPKQASHGPAMSRPANGPAAAPRPATAKGSPKSAGDRPAPKVGGGPKGAGDRPSPKVGGGPSSGDRAAGNFQRPTQRPADAKPGGPKPGGPKVGGDNKVEAKTADRRPARPGSGGSSEQLNDFLGGGAGRPGGPGLDRPGAGKKDDRPIAGKKDDRPDIAKKGDRPAIDRKDDRPIAGKKADQPNITVEGDVTVGGGTRVNYADNQKAWVDNRHATGNQVRANSGNRYATAYSSDTYRRGLEGGYAYNRGWAGRGAYHGWTAASSAGLGAFLGAGAVAREPSYFAYGDGGNVYYEDDSVYVNGQSAGTAEQYARQALAYVAAAPPPEKAADAEWLPLGAFAFTREDVDDSQGMIELAINKQGVLAGTYYNEATGVSRPLRGTLDQKSQRVAVGFADGKNDDLALETGIHNLTKDEAPALMHFGTTRTTPVLLVRLQPPQ